MDTALCSPPHARTPTALAGVCPLCGEEAFANDGTVEAYVSLLRCSACRAFVIERQLVRVIANAREKNLRPVLRHLASLSTAARSAAARGAVPIFTSTNWIRIALEQQRIESQPTRQAHEPGVPSTTVGDSLHNAGASEGAL